jgi:hypothetical protein
MTPTSTGDSIPVSIRLLLCNEAAELTAVICHLQATAAAWIGTATEEAAPTRTTAPKLRRLLRR